MSFSVLFEGTYGTHPFTRHPASTRFEQSSMGSDMVGTFLSQMCTRISQDVIGTGFPSLSETSSLSPGSGVLDKTAVLREKRRLYKQKYRAQLSAEQRMKINAREREKYRRRMDSYRRNVL